MSKIRLATVWLDGCSGCHMSLLDIDESLALVAEKADIVYGPLVDAQEFPEEVDVTLVEGAVSSQSDLRMIQNIRARTRLLVALGDCAVTGNVPAMRNRVPVRKLLERVYLNGAQTQQSIPGDGVPALLDRAVPVHDVVKVDLHVPGCPPPAPAILSVVGELLAGGSPDAACRLKFG
jgi:NAD-reducing hydrogenase small subunit